MNARADWLQARTTGIGGSDVAALLGLSKWKTPLALYREKRGEGEPQEDNEAMRWGRYLEPVVRQAYSDRTGREVRVPPDMLRHPLHEHMLANLDGVAGGATELLRVFEAKTARSAEGWGEPGSDQIPQTYLLQVQHYMEVTGIQVADVAVLIGGSDFRIYEVPADRELQAMLIDAEAEFWQRVQLAEPPEPVTVDDMVARWGRSSREESVVASDDVRQAVERLRALKLERERIDAAEEEARAAVMHALAKRDTLVDKTGRTLATWRAAKPAQRFDAAALKAAQPALHAQYLRAGEPSRRLLIKP